VKELKTTITPNPYFWIPDGNTSLTAALLEHKYTNECYYIKLLLNYPVAEYKNADLFQYFDQYSLRLLRLKKTILIFDATFEGFSPNEVPIADALYENCLKYNVDPSRIFFFTGNLIHKDEKINVIPMFILAKQSSWANNQSMTFNESKNQCEQNYQKPILSLSRRNRFHRVLAHCMLFNSSLYNDCIISQDVVNFKISHDVTNQMGLTESEVNNFKNSLPLIADKNQFDINDPFNSLSKLHSETLFSIVNETLAYNFDNTTLFFSEKFLKPIINFQPMLIYGHQGINKKLTLLGFKTYEDYFDLSFDDEPNDIIRYRKLLESASAVLENLKTMSRQDQINWRFKNQELLEFNYQNFLKCKHADGSLKHFINIVENIR